MKTFIEANLIFPRDKKFNMVMENAGIAFQKRYNDKKNKTLVYENCIFTNKQEIAFLKEISKYTIQLDMHQITDRLYKVYGDGGSFNNGYKNEDLPMFATSSTIIFEEISNSHKKSLIKDLDTSIKKNLDIIPFHENSKIIVNSIKEGTNNEGELLSIIKGIDYLKETYPDTQMTIIVSSDSQYVMKGGSEWIYGWFKRGWKNNENQATKNLDMWKKFYTYLHDQNLNIRFRWQRGHVKKPFNEAEWFNYLCDKMCNIEINRYLSEYHSDLYKQYKRKI